MQTYHLTPDAGRWSLRGENSERALCDFETKEQAVERCAQLMETQTGSLKIHKSDGTIEEERTYPRSADPRETPG